MTAELFWFFLLVLFLGLFGVGYSLYSLKKRNIQTFLPGMPEFRFELDSEKIWRVAFFWESVFVYLFFGIACMIVGMYGLFFV